jgi:hypothetical protein
MSETGSRKIDTTRGVVVVAENIQKNVLTVVGITMMTMCATDGIMVKNLDLSRDKSLLGSQNLIAESSWRKRGIENIIEIPLLVDHHFCGDSLHSIRIIAAPLDLYSINVKNIRPRLDVRTCIEMIIVLPLIPRSRCPRLADFLLPDAARTASTTITALQSRITPWMRIIGRCLKE